MDNLTLLAIFITLLWFAVLAYYFYVSRQQRDIAEEIEELRDMLDRVDKNDPQNELQGKT